jgi:lysyl-tRNA synthetase class 2
MGDIVGVVGTLFRTRTGELTVDCSEIRLLPSRCGRCRRSSTA